MREPSPSNTPANSRRCRRSRDARPDARVRADATWLLFRKITPRSETLRKHWALKPFSRFFGDPRLWSLQRRTVTPAFGAGLAICFVPLPIHIPLAAMVAIFCRIHVPTIMLALMR